MHVLFLVHITRETFRYLLNRLVKRENITLCVALHAQFTIYRVLLLFSRIGIFCLFGFIVRASRIQDRASNMFIRGLRYANDVQVRVRVRVLV